MNYLKVGMPFNSEVEGWFAGIEPPAEPAMRRVLDVLSRMRVRPAWADDVEPPVIPSPPEALHAVDPVDR